MANGTVTGRTLVAIRMDEALKAAGLPLVGVRDLGTSFQREYSRALTGPEQATEAAVLAGLDMTLKKLKALAAVKAEVDALTTGQRAALLNWVAATWILEHPKLATLFGLIDPYEPE